VTCDETWVHCFTPESKRASNQRKHTHSPPPKKAKAIFSAGRIMTAVFWDSKGIIHLDFLTVKKNHQCSVLLNSPQSEEKGRIQFSSSQTTLVLTLQL
jgi:hypothetical protein